MTVQGYPFIPTKYGKATCKKCHGKFNVKENEKVSRCPVCGAGTGNFADVW